MGKDSFAGFPDGTFAFLRGLAKNNNKVWFDAHRDDYEQYYVAPARALVEALGPRLRKISPGVSCEPQVNGSIFRINRDVRFSKDKTPYRTNLDLWFWHGERGGWSAPGFFFRLSADKLGLGVGMHMLQKEQLAAFRAAVLDPKSGTALDKTIARVRAAGPYVIGGAMRKTVPRGFDPNHERAGFLLHKGLWVDMERDADKTERSPDFVEFCARHYAAMWPIGKWLLGALGGG
jgi:uncharacterized protein (TIGR02453 family)